MGDRRVQMTKKMLRVALLEELREKQLSQISIKQLCQTADVNRSTFYVYYQDIQQLFNEIEDDFLSHMVVFNPDMPSADIITQLQNMVRYFQENRETYIALIENGNYVAKCVQLATNALNKQIKDVDDPHVKSLLAAYTVNGSVAMIYEWLQNPGNISDIQIAETLLRISTDIAELLDA